jgi:hypothetical protein
MSAQPIALWLGRLTVSSAVSVRETQWVASDSLSGRGVSTTLAFMDQFDLAYGPQHSHGESLPSCPRVYAGIGSMEIDLVAAWSVDRLGRRLLSLAGLDWSTS